MSVDMMVVVIAVVLTASLGSIAALCFSGKGQKLDSRIDTLVGREAAAEKNESVVKIARSALPKIGKIIVPEDEAERTKLRARLVHAGLYHRQSMYVFLGVKLAMLSVATVVGAGLTLLNIFPISRTLPISAGLFLVGMIGPSFWLDGRKKARQKLLRRGLADALDVLVICVEGGLSLQAGIKRVADEMCYAHPVLGSELRIIDREIQLGRSPGDALQHFAQRTDLDEVVALASVIGQSERFGASLVKSLRSHGESLRIKRKQAAEEDAQKASTKILMPTLLLIFPAIFVILLAPAVYMVSKTLFGPGAP